jgi:hypothetical protein
MNDDTERRLRDERGPRERDYHPIQLQPAPSSHSGAAGIRRWSLVAATALTAVLAVGFMAGRFSPSGDAAGNGGSPAAADSSLAITSASPDASSAMAGCQPANLLLQPEAWGGAAGSRGTVLHVTLVDGAAGCDLEQPLSVRIMAGASTQLVVGSSEETAPVSLAPGDELEYAVRWSDWCGDEPAALGWEVRFGSGPWLALADDVSAADSIPVPPCLGDGGTQLDVTQLAP